ncbi:MAG: hypothetical protein QNJ55_19225 [Xenococcus sp. MO_188.B8]|nr:hypothetical protein [Xenococcus sp. MO_188.B8]
MKNKIFNKIIATTAFASLVTTAIPQVALSESDFVRVCKQDNSNDSKAWIYYEDNGELKRVEGEPKGNGKIKKWKAQTLLEDAGLSESEADDILKSKVNNKKITEIKIKNMDLCSDESTTVINNSPGNSGNAPGQNKACKNNNGIGNNYDIEYVIDDETYTVRIDPGNSGQMKKFEDDLADQGYTDTQIASAVDQIWDAEMKINSGNGSSDCPSSVNGNDDYTILGDQYSSKSDFPFYRGNNNPTDFHSVVNGSDVGVDAFQEFSRTESSAIDLSELQARKLDTSNLELTYDAEVIVYFINEGAGFRNQLRFESTGTTEESGMIFYDVSCHGTDPDCGYPGGGPSNVEDALELGDYVNLGNLAAGTSLDFQVLADGYNNSNAPVWYTDSTRNVDGIQHLIAYAYEGYLVLAYEDLWGGGDNDYNDVVFAVYIGENNLNAIPTEGGSSSGSSEDLGEIDTDYDGIPDSIEIGADSSNPTNSDQGLKENGSPHPNPNWEDHNPDYQDDDSDNNGISDALEAGIDPTNPVDSDGDGTYDFQDPDDDNNGILDVYEIGDDSDSNSGYDLDGDGADDIYPNDFDNDGIPDYLDNDDDDDGILDGVEIAGNPDNPADTDGDGADNYQDTDSDGDTIPDSVEGMDDADGDGAANYLDTDSDGDTILDSDEVGSDPNNPQNTDQEAFENSYAPVDGDDIPDFLDSDSDNDGIPDSVEAGDDDPNTPPANNNTSDDRQSNPYSYFDYTAFPLID